LDEGKGKHRIMKRIQIIGLTLFALFAFGATASSALATEWLVEKLGFAGSLAVETEGELELIKLVSSTNSAVLVALLCSGIFDGFIINEGGEALDEIVDLLNLLQETIGELGMAGEELALSCTVTQSASGSLDCVNGSLAELWPDNLNLVLGHVWLTAIELMEPSPGVILLLDKLFGEGAGLEPGYDIDCLDAFTILGEELCEGPSSADVTNDLTSMPPGVLGKFSSAEGIGTELVDCTGTGTQTAELFGEGHTWAIGLELEHLETAIDHP
jgi:hypothetical protein